MTDSNPYSAPQAEVHDRDVATGQYRLASPWVRLGAVLIDTLLGALCALPIFLGNVTSGDMAFAGMVVGGILTLGLFVYQLVLLAQNGWTVGKRTLGVRIVRSDLRDASLGRIFGLRMMVPGLVSLIPVLGVLFTIVDPLFIFSPRHRTIHDRIADTVVVLA